MLFVYRSYFLFYQKFLLKFLGQKKLVYVFSVLLIQINQDVKNRLSYELDITFLKISLNVNIFMIPYQMQIFWLVTDLLCQFDHGHCLVRAAVRRNDMFGAYHVHEIP